MELSTLIRNLNPVKGVISRPHYEAYCNEQGYLDAPYISYLCERRLTTKGLNSQVNTAVGAAAFIPEENDDLEVLTYDEFLGMYEFGKFKSTRGYIMYAFERTGKVLTRENLFAWVLTQ
jgi:hypothetical protein